MKTITLADVKDVDPEDQRRFESAYRRGLHHGVALCQDLADQAATLPEVRRLLRRAANLAHSYRDQRRHPGRPPILDELRRKLAAKNLWSEP